MENSGGQTKNVGPLTQAQILSPSIENITLAAEAIQRGEVVGIPTETVYGLAGDCRNPLAITRIFETKERPSFDPLIVHVGPQGRSVQGLKQLRLIDATELSEPLCRMIDQLIEKFWPGPLTLVLPKHVDVSDLVTSGLPSVALRMPSHPVAQALIAASHTALAAPSANRFGRISPTTAKAVFEELGDRIDFILEGGPCQVGIESTVLRIDPMTSQPWILRHGGIPKELIEETLKVQVLDPLKDLAEPSASDSKQDLLSSGSPGMLASHYAPAKPLYLLPKEATQLQSSDLTEIESILTERPKIGLLLVSGNPDLASKHLAQITGCQVLARTLSLNGNPQEAARNLFAEMRFLDSSAASFILSETYLRPVLGLHHAIADRLKRASHR